MRVSIDSGDNVGKNCFLRNGRREQTILTDQDSLLVYRAIPLSRQSLETKAYTKLIRRDIREKPLDESQIDFVDSYFEIFSRKMADYLDEMGIKRCMGGVMPTNEKWRDSLQGWIDRLKQKINRISVVVEGKIVGIVARGDIIRALVKLG